MSDLMMRKELQEAITAGEDALYSLYEARDQLGKARSWGIVDLLGGGLITDLIKHSKMDRAQHYLEEARRKLKRFQKELRDVTFVGTMNLNVGSFLSFADFFFDGVVADYLVQSKIAETREEVEDAIDYTEELVAQLRGRLTQY